MSKEIRAFKNIKKFIGKNIDKGSIEESYQLGKDVAVVEKGLKRLETLDSGAFVCIHVNRYDELEKKERAFDIIKEKNVDVGFYLEESGSHVRHRKVLTEQEENFLKELLQ